MLSIAKGALGIALVIAADVRLLSSEYSPLEGDTDIRALIVLISVTLFLIGTILIMLRRSAS